MRAFTAIELPREALSRLGDLVASLRTSRVRARWTPVENIHLTLVFLGEIDDAHVTPLSTRLREACLARAPLSLTVEGTGAFPSVRRPSVIWAGVRTTEALLELQAAVVAAADAIGVPRERRPYRGHLTLARIRDGSDAGPLAAALERHRAFDGGAFDAVSVSLFESRLTSSGAQYRRIEAFRLGADA